MTDGGVSGTCGASGGGKAAVCLGAAPIAAFAGVVALGIADAAASAIGLRFGRHRIFTGPSAPPEPPAGRISRCWKPLSTKGTYLFTQAHGHVALGHRH